MFCLTQYNAIQVNTTTNYRVQNDTVKKKLNMNIFIKVRFGKAVIFVYIPFSLAYLIHSAYVR